MDGLLASPQYGERWARHWLDVARFGESDGFERDFPRDNLWPYRDWVIAALNADMPYDEFTRKQIAGDLITPGFEGKAAVAFLVAGLHNTVVGGSEFMQKTARQDELEEITGTVGQTFLGLTINCARCHDHKYDPISQKEYYQMASAFQGVFHKELETQDKRKIYSVRANETPGVTRVLKRGNALQPVEQVAPQAPAAVTGPQADFGLPQDAPDAERCTKLAAWITHPDNPLFTRVIVNRLWHHHFGTGLVNTPNDLGLNGGRPSHPQLLDWLAGELKANGYRLKPLHRLMVTSNAYRQSSKPRPQAMAVDANNRLLWRKSPARLDAESLRDAMLQVSGLLNLEAGGPGFRDVAGNHNDGTTYYTPFDKDDDASLNRRSIYRFSPRGQRGAILETFDCPDPATTAPSRSVTTSPLQALALLNNAFVLRMANGFARRAEREVGTDPNKQTASSAASLTSTAKWCMTSSPDRRFRKGLSRWRNDR